MNFFIQNKFQQVYKKLNNKNDKMTKVKKICWKNYLPTFGKSKVCILEITYQ